MLQSDVKLIWLPRGKMLREREIKRGKKEQWEEKDKESKQVKKRQRD
jgi:hypothetical protein